MTRRSLLSFLCATPVVAAIKLPTTPMPPLPPGLYVADYLTPREVQMFINYYYTALAEGIHVTSHAPWVGVRNV